MSDHPMVQALHAAISRRSWNAVEQAANRIRDDWSALPTEMHSAVRVWLECPADRRPSAWALGKRIEEIASALTNGDRQ